MVAIRILVGALLALAHVAAPAQGWQPTKPIEINAPTTPGGSVDMTARLLQKILQDSGLVKVPVSVSYEPRGGGAVDRRCARRARRRSRARPRCSR